jgi:hypothetical protein
MVVKAESRMPRQRSKFNPGEIVVLASAPPELLQGLPPSDQREICDFVGKPVKFIKFDNAGYAELELVNSTGHSRWIWVRSEFIEPSKAK